MVALVGGIPEPVGGITNYLYRLGMHYSDDVDKIIDLYPCKNKWNITNISCYVRPRSYVCSVFWFLFHLYTFSGKIYFNFSTPRSLILFILLPKKRSNKWFLTLHHGDLCRYIMYSNFINKIVYKLALKRIDKVGYIGGNQKIFFRFFKVKRNKLYRISTYLPFIASLEKKNAFSKLLEKELNKIKNNYKKIVVASGYPTKIYRHDWVLDFFEHVDLAEGSALILCLYGMDSENRLDMLLSRADKMPNVFVYKYLSPDQFQTVLSTADIYVRPTKVDSFGVAVAEALCLGLKVVASDACERAKGAFIFDRNDKHSFITTLSDIINDNKLFVEEYIDQNLNDVSKFLGLS